MTEPTWMVENWWNPAQKESAIAWIEQAMAEWSLHLEGELQEVQSRPWSVVLAVPSSEGSLYFKASGPALAYEAGLTQWLSAHYPELAPAVVAAEAEFGWLLLEDGGRRLRESAEGDNLVSVWRELLPTYARFQSECIPYINEFLSMGVPDRRLDALPGHVARWRGELEMQSEWEEGLSPEELGNLAAMEPELVAICDELEALGPAATINHGDLHDGNVFWVNGSCRIFDWGDASLTHPFFSLRTTFVSIENRLGWEEGDQRFDELRQCYLEGWCETFELQELERSFGLASKVWSIVTALNWEGALSAGTEEQRADYSHVLPSLMRELMEAVEG